MCERHSCRGVVQLKPCDSTLRSTHDVSTELLSRIRCTECFDNVSSIRCCGGLLREEVRKSTNRDIGLDERAESTVRPCKQVIWNSACWHVDNNVIFVKLQNTLRPVHTDTRHVDMRAVSVRNRFRELSFLNVCLVISSVLIGVGRPFRILHGALVITLERDIIWLQVIVNNDSLVQHLQLLVCAPISTILPIGGLPCDVREVIKTMTENRLVRHGVYSVHHVVTQLHAEALCGELLIHNRLDLSPYDRLAEKYGRIENAIEYNGFFVRCTIHT